MLYDLHKPHLSLPAGVSAVWVDWTPSTFTYGRARIDAALTEPEMALAGIEPVENPEESDEAERERSRLHRAESPHSYR